MKNKVFAAIAINLLCFSAFLIFTPKIAANGNSWAMKQMTKNDVEDTLDNWNAISGDGSRIVFDRRPSQWGPEGYGVDWDIYAMNIWDDLGEERQMTTAWGEDVEAGISFDGNMIAFASGRFHVGEPWDLEIFAMNYTDSPGQEVQVSDNSTYLDGYVALSGNGKTLAWNTGPNTVLKHAEYITLANITDSGHIIHTIIDTPEWDVYPTLSRDGKKVCFNQFTNQVNLGVFVANTDGTGLTRIPGAYGQGVISGDGTKAAVMYKDGDWEFSIVDVATGNTLFKTENNVYDGFGSFDSSGNVIAYSREGEIYICDLQTKQETRLTYDSYEDYAPRLDGDGDTIAFVSIGRDGPDSEIFVLTFPSVAATIDIDPDILNLGSKGKWITVYIELTEGYSVADINVSTIMLNDTVPAELSPTSIGDHDGDGIPDLMVKFDRDQVISYILAKVNITELTKNKSMTITLSMTSNLNDGTLCKGGNTITILLNTPKGGGSKAKHT